MNETNFYKIIDEILWKYWDPIEVNENEEARSEYQNYTWQVYKLKIGKASIEEISKHLYKIEVDDIGLLGNLKHCEEVARKIIEI